MVDLERMFSSEEKSQITAAVQLAEATTSAEIVPAVAEASGRYDRGEDTFGFWLAAAFAASMWWFWPHRTDTGAWGEGSPWIAVIVLIVGMMLVYILGAVIASRTSWLRRLLTPESHMEDEVAGRARQVFFDRRVHHTKDGSGLLIYLSMEERMAFVCADQAVTAALGDEGLNELRTLLVSMAKDAGPTDALCAVIAEAGRRLAAPLPRATSDQNELADALVLLPAP